MKLRVHQIFFVVVVLGFGVLSSTLAQALEIHMILKENCSAATGVVIYTSPTHIELLTLDGKSENIARADIRSLFIYNTIGVPFRNFPLSKPLIHRLRTVELDANISAQTIGWPVKFVENLVMFLDVRGKIHVYELDLIRKLRPVWREANGGSVPALTMQGSKSDVFEPDGSAASDQCPGSFQKKSSATPPTRWLTDKIRINDYLKSLEQGYEVLDSFQERTYLYAKPILFDVRTRFGISIYSRQSEPNPTFPFYFQWFKGRPYRFQSFTMLGAKPSLFLPSVEPGIGVSSEVKSHVFHALFVGNFLGLSAGSAIFTKNDFQDIMTSKPSSAVSHNYMALMGGDYGPFSVSGGFFYPVLLFTQEEQVREVLASDLSYALRFMLTYERWRFRVVGSWLDRSDSSPTRKEVIRENGGTRLVDPDSFTLNFGFLRPGIDFHLSRAIELNLDFMYATAKYSEKEGSSKRTYNFQKQNVIATVRQSFSEYVTVSVTGNFVNRNDNANLTGTTQKKSKQESTFFGSFEFVF